MSLRTRALYTVLLAGVSISGVSILGCDRAPGHPGPGPEVVRPEEVLDSAVLYKTNCAACHGENGKDGVAIALANPTYLAFVGEETLREVTAKGIHGKLMPSFARSAGGSLTDQQVNVLVHGIMQRWSNPGAFAGRTIPAYRASLAPDANRGEQAYATFCASCHGDHGQGKSYLANGKTVTAGSIVDESYLALVSDQALRSFIVAGVPDSVMPDYRSDASVAMTDQQITDVVGWLAAKRTLNPGQPYTTRP